MPAILVVFVVPHMILRKVRLFVFFFGLVNDFLRAELSLFFRHDSWLEQIHMREYAIVHSAASWRLLRGTSRMLQFV